MKAYLDRTHGVIDIVLHEPWNGKPLTDEEMVAFYGNEHYIERYVSSPPPDDFHYKEGDFVYGPHSVRRPGVIVGLLVKERWAKSTGNNGREPYGTDVDYVVRWLERKGRRNELEICSWRGRLKSFIGAIKTAEEQLRGHRKNLKALKEFAFVIEEAKVHGEL